MDVFADETVMIIPLCDDDIKPAKGKCFGSLREAQEFYKRYARAVGFDCRFHGLKKHNDVSVWRYMVCSREGSNPEVINKKCVGNEVVEKKRRRMSARCGCMARISFRFDANLGYVTREFIEEHNHSLVEPKYKHFMKINRRMDEIHKMFVLDCAAVSIGPTHAHKLLGELMGGAENIGCTLVDARNFSRDMNVFVEGTDAQMLLDELERKKELYVGFMYSYELDEEHRLKRICWCDPISRRNFRLFGDVVAFDTTYSTNKYSMIFAPFTGKDNHGRPVTFAAGLLTREDADSFSWLFKNFVEFMGSMPSIIITDQDLGMKVAVERVLVGVRHRWCMWHIMLKLADKVSKTLHANEDFKNDLNSCVWSDLIEPCEFDVRWACIMKKYNLEADPWFLTMYEARNFWVPAFFRDIPMGGLLRTTSISECENSFFKRYTRSTASLIIFWMQYNRALDAQRLANDKLNYDDLTSSPALVIKSSMEKHAASIYTSHIFCQVQGELRAACFECSISKMHTIDDREEFVIHDGHHSEYAVLHHKSNGTYICGCKMFTRIGLLCCHIFLVLKNKRLDTIPTMYLSGRWLKSSMAKPVHIDGPSNDVTHSVFDESRKISSDLLCSFFGWHHKFAGDIEKMKAFLACIDESGREIAGSELVDLAGEKKRTFENFFGCPMPDEVEVLPPRNVKTKGSGSRLVSRKEKAVRVSNKPLRRCAKCNQLARHDARNCDKFQIVSNDSP